MIVKLLRDHLPWVAPSAAIVFAASGYFDRGGYSSEQAAQAPATVANTVNAQASQPVQSGFVASGVATTSNDVVTRLSMVTDSSLQALEPTPQPAADLNRAVALAIKPQEQVVAAPEAPAKAPIKTASLQETESAAAFFTDAQANLIAQESCVNDLRAVSDQARVYFPAGGLTLDESGIAQARLIASLVQECKGVQIIVEGHSDPSGDADVNLKLSKQRAEQVIQRLGASGLDTSFFTAQGLGSQKPSKIIGPKGSAYYDRRVEFVVIETNAAAGSNRFKARPSAWASSTCVSELENAIADTRIFYAPRSVAAQQQDLNVAMELATMAMSCPNVRLRVIGQHSDDLRSGENPATGRFRAKALMAMLVGQGIDSGQIIMASPSRSMATDALSGSRLDFDVIVE